MALRRQANPPEGGPEVHVRRLKKGEAVSVTIYSHAVWGFLCHWNGRFTEECNENPRECRGCQKGYPQKWKGYLFVMNEANRQPEFLELTPTSRDFIVNSFKPGEEMRGCRMTVTRGKGDKARLQIMFMPCLQTPQSCPKDLDPAPTLERLWSMVPGRLRPYRPGELEERGETA